MTIDFKMVLILQCCSKPRKKKSFTKYQNKLDLMVRLSDVLWVQKIQHVQLRLVYMCNFKVTIFRRQFLLASVEEENCLILM